MWVAFFMPEKEKLHLIYGKPYSDAVCLIIIKCEWVCR